MIRGAISTLCMVRTVLAFERRSFGAWMPAGIAIIVPGISAALGATLGSRRARDACGLANWHDYPIDEVVGYMIHSYAIWSEKRPDS
jgi:hypothetical protein